MANSLGIQERTLAQVSAATNSINVVSPTNERKSSLQPIVVRISDHADNDGAETADPYKMAIFTSKAVGHPWIKDTGLRHIVVEADADPVTNATRTDVTVLYPNFNYSTFE